MRALLFIALAAFATAAPFDVELLSRGGCDACQAMAKQVAAMKKEPWLSTIKDAVLNMCPDDAPCELLADLLPGVVTKFEEEVLAKYCTVDTCTKEAKAFSACSAIDEAIKLLPTIFNVVKDVCKILPGSLGNSCSNFLDKFLPAIQKGITGILNDVKKLLKCQSEKIAVPIVPQSQPSISKCQLCQEGMQVIDYLLNSALVKGNLQKLLGAECANLPSPYNAECNATVYGGFNEIIKYAQNMLGYICTDAAGCPSGYVVKRLTLHDLMRLQKAASGSEICQAFQNIYNDVPNLIMKFAGVCDVIPTQYQAGCKNLFANDKQAVVKMADEVVVFMAQHIPFVDCHLNQTLAIAQYQESAECAACNGAVDLMRYLLTSPLIEGGAETALENLCNELPFGQEQKNACKESVQGSISAILNFASSMLDTICPAAIPSCKATSRTPEEFAQLLATGQLDTSGICGAFQRIYDDVPNLVMNFVGVCDVIPTQYQQGCKDFFNNDKPMVVHMAQEAVVFMADHVPFANCHINTNGMSAEASSAGCDACKGAIDVVDTVITSPLLQGLFGDLLDKLCADLPSSLSTPCKETVNSSLKAILNYVASLLKDICPAAIPGCNFAEGMSKERRICEVYAHIKDHLPANVAKFAGVCKALKPEHQAVCFAAYNKDTTPFVKGADMVVDWLAERALCKTEDKAAISQNSAGCDACKGAIDVVDTVITSSLLQGLFGDLLDKLCEELPSDLTTPCKETVDSSLKAILDYVATMLKDICPAAIPGCNFGADMEKERRVCAVYDHIKENLPKNVAKFAGVCKALKPEHQAACFAAYNKDTTPFIKGADMVVDWLAERALCKSEEKAAVQKNSAGCDACKGAIDVVDTVITSPLLQGLFGDLLDKLCADLPSSLSTPCKETVNSSLKAILNYVAQMLKDICPAAIPGCDFAANVEKEKRVCMVFAAIKADMVKDTTKLAGVCNVLEKKYQLACADAYMKSTAPFVDGIERAVDFFAKKAHC